MAEVTAQQSYSWWKEQQRMRLKYETLCAQGGHRIHAFENSYVCYGSDTVARGCYHKVWCEQHFDQHQREVHNAC